MVRAMKLDLKQVILDLEHKSKGRTHGEGLEGYLACIDDLKDHPMIKEATAPQPGPKRTPEEIEKSKQPKEKVEEDMSARTGVSTCKFCNGKGFTWTNRGTEDEPQWKLVDDNGSVHFCR